MVTMVGRARGCGLRVCRRSHVWMSRSRSCDARLPRRRRTREVSAALAYYVANAFPARCVIIVKCQVSSVVINSALRHSIRQDICSGIALDRCTRSEFVRPRPTAIFALVHDRRREPCD